MTQAPSFVGEQVATRGRAASKYVPVTPGSGDLPDGVCDALLVGTGGTANLTQPDGVDRDSVPLQVGYNPLRVSKVRALGTAANVWAVYY